jgi:hypothetical protein
MSALYQHHLCYLRNDKTSGTHLDIFPAHFPWTWKKKNYVPVFHEKETQTWCLYLILVIKKLFNLTSRGFRSSGIRSSVIGWVAVSALKGHNAFTAVSRLLVFWRDTLPLPQCQGCWCFEGTHCLYRTVKAVGVLKGHTAFTTVSRLLVFWRDTLPLPQCQGCWCFEGTHCFYRSVKAVGVLKGHTAFTAVSSCPRTTVHYITLAHQKPLFHCNSITR